MLQNELVLTDCCASKAARTIVLWSLTGRLLGAYAYVSGEIRSSFRGRNLPDGFKMTFKHISRKQFFFRNNIFMNQNLKKLRP
jgi:hypothetical protein